MLSALHELRPSFIHARRLKDVPAARLSCTTHNGCWQGAARRLHPGDQALKRPFQLHLNWVVRTDTRFFQHTHFLASYRAVDYEVIKAADRRSMSERRHCKFDQNSWQLCGCRELPKDFGLHVEVTRQNPQSCTSPYLLAGRLQYLLVSLRPLLCVVEVNTEDCKSSHDKDPCHREPPLVLELFALPAPVLARPIPAPSAWALQ